MSWPVLTLDDLKAPEPRSITDGPFGSNLARRHYTASGPRVVRLQNIGDGVFIDEKAHISEDHFAKLRAHEVRPGDLLIASLGEVLPRACIAPENLGPAIVKADCIRVRLRDDVDARWVLYALERPFVRRWAEEHRHGMGRPRLGLKTIRQIPIPLPSLNEQRRIVAILEDHLSRLDAAESGLRAAMRRLKTLREVALSLALPKAKLSESVTIHRLGDLAKIGTGMTPLRGKKEFYEGGTIPWITSGDLHQGLIRCAKNFVTQEALSQTSLKVVPAGSLLVAMYGEGKTRGTAAELGIDATTNQACASVILHDQTLRPWVRLVLDANYANLRRLAAGGVQPNLNLTLVKAIEVPIPPVSQRQQILRAVAEIDDATASLQVGLDKAVQRGAVLRRSLLVAAFSGRLTRSQDGLSAVTEMMPA